MKKTILLAAAAALLICSVAPAALAQEKEKEGRERVSQRLQERWERVQERLELIITRFDNNKERHVKAYNEAKEKVSRVLEEAQARGLDVSKLSGDLAVWDEMIRGFAADYSAMIDKLREIVGMDAGEADREFVKVLREAREMLRKVHQDAMDIRLFYQKTIRSDIQELRSQWGGEGSGT